LPCSSSVAPDEWRDAQAFCLPAEGDAEWLGDDVELLLGRPARSFEQFAADYATIFS
jgi:hypothetical protein